MVTRYVVPSLLMATFLLWSTPSHGKGITIQLTITGPQLPLPVHTDDPEAISANVWGTNFFNQKAGLAHDPRDEENRLTVYFWVRLPDKSVQMKYVVWYTWLPEQDYAVLCFPAPRQSYWYRLNTFSILREGVDGRCFRAEEDWGRAIQRVIQDSTGR